MKNKIERHRSFHSLVFITSLMLTLSCSGRKEIQQEGASVNENVITLNDAQLKNAGIIADKLKQRTLSSILKVNGRVDVPPQNMISVSVPLGGYLKYSKLLPGMHVTKGEVIAVMEDQQYIQLQQDFLTAKAKLKFIAHEYQRQKELNQSKATSDKIFQQAEADYSTIKINVTALGEKLKLIGINPERLDEGAISKSINIYSPIDGYVSMVNVNIGKYTQPSEVLFELINPSDIHLALTVFEKDLDKISIGQKVIAYTNSKPGKRHTCEIILIGKDLSPERSAEIHCHFENYDKTLVPGMYMNAEIELVKTSAYVLPEESIVRFENRQYVFVEKSKYEFEMMEVHIGATEGGFTEIIEGHQQAESRFVIKGAYSLLMKIKNKAEE